MIRESAVFWDTVVPLILKLWLISRKLHIKDVKWLHLGRVLKERRIKFVLLLISSHKTAFCLFFFFLKEEGKTMNTIQLDKFNQLDKYNQLG